MSPTFGLRVEACIDTSTDRPVQRFFDHLLPEEGRRMSLAREAKGDAGYAWSLLAYFGRESAGALTLLAEGEREAAAARSHFRSTSLNAASRRCPSAR